MWFLGLLALGEGLCGVCYAKNESFMVMMLGWENKESDLSLYMIVSLLILLLKRRRLAAWGVHSAVAGRTIVRLDGVVDKGMEALRDSRLKGWD